MINSLRNIVSGDVIKYFKEGVGCIKAEITDDWYTPNYAVHIFLLEELNGNSKETIRAIKLYNSEEFEVIKKVPEPLRTALTRDKKRRHRRARLGLKTKRRTTK